MLALGYHPTARLSDMRHAAAGEDVARQLRPAVGTTVTDPTRASR